MPRRNKHGRQTWSGRWGSRRKRGGPDAEDGPVEPPAPRRGRDWDRPRHRAVEPVMPPVWTEAPPAPAVARVCGNCREWFGEEVGGRGDCAHPGSGFLRPWSDTPACPFFEARR